MCAHLRVCSLAATLTVVVLASGCGSPDDRPQPNIGDQDESWGEASFGKADGTGSDATVAARKALIDQFRAPTLSEAERAELLQRYAGIDVDQVVPRALFEPALVYYDFNLALLENPRYLTVIDFSQHSYKRRLYVVDMESGLVERHVVAHGSGSDPDDDGIPTHFSNVPNSNASSLGYYLTAETYSGKHGLSMRLDGLSDTNSNVRARAVVVHGASYVVDGRAKQGRSWGCPAVPMSEKNALISKLEGGSVMYAERSASD